MAQQIADRRDIDFVLHEQLNVDQFSKSEKYAEFNKKTVDLIVSEARNLAVKEILPTRSEGDEIGCKFENGKVIVPELFRKPYELLCEGEWTAMPEDPDYGGQGMPRSVTMAAAEYFNGANYAFMMYSGLTHGAGKLVEAFGTDEQKRIYLKKMFTGEWGGTMCLTEPDAGSDVGALTTKAVPNGDGTYTITGQKIFISSGDHDLVENIIHPVLARIEGAPAGTKGISLFAVPKIRVNDDGSLGEPNDMSCVGIEEKMGIHGNSTCTLTFGEKGNCIGTLLGEENKGLRAMFLMMNEARLLVGMQGFACATASYMNAVNYAKERIQGRNLLEFMNPDAPGVAIINHPDVRRQLLTMKAYVEGMRSLLYYVAWCEDKADTMDDEKEKEKYHDLIELLIPIAKGYVTDRAFDVCNGGMQVYGGYGYIKEYPQEQLMRDCRITMIYEGTNGIQSMDLLGRKLGMKKGKLVMDLMGEIMAVTGAAKQIDSIKDYAVKLEEALNKLGEVAMHMGKIAMSEKVLTAFAFSYPFMEVCGDVVMAWMLLWRAKIAAEALEKAKKKDIPFYEGQLKSAQYFCNTVLPATLGKMNAILATDGAAIEIDEASFIG
ncbi:MAG: acyl-CoA dehydrogenase [Desulfobacteraceae bacterium]|nr:acyl-CoA dehydrogenase [Desulfobacteraceae bacterium]MBC2757948.1 acyl-CoA dehydrogenase [Desulfobacteraceae bacterium]